MTVNGITRRRQHLSTFAAVGFMLFAAITIAVHSLQSTAPLWMAAAIAGSSALLITDAGMAMATVGAGCPKRLRR